ncbi:hypothetical protein AHMF7605_18940 [Adhaeribacter arboris]|uniref:DUF4168 domain-containing protein n=1 Tax=Adhaeribacter arboris TaxID=2072846 RepID=A0A2T2YIV2_9BACT|nr:hypothetical protein [Adhaeribacter arboris]PSR55432.1 hypothetical protein AHMF7605_18940 [Adhaeribacter arboris]
MKKFFTTTLLILSFVIAQATSLVIIKKDRGNDERLKMQAIEQTRQLAVKIGLNEADYIRVKNITYQKLVATQEAEEMYANNPEIKAKKLLAIETQFNEQLAGAISARQHKMYLSLASIK